jgi:FkbM family methyltransferase
MIKEAAGFYEADLLQALASLLSPDDLVVDVGASFGNYAVFFSLIGQCRVVSYEPRKTAEFYLRKNVEINNISERVEIRSIPDSVTPPMSGDKDPQSSLPDTAASREAQAGALALINLDDEPFSSRIKLIRIDAKAMDASVLHGASTLIQKDRPFVVLEGVPASEFATVTSVMEAFDYSGISVFDANDICLFSPVSSSDERKFTLQSSWREAAQSLGRARELSSSTHAVGEEGSTASAQDLALSQRLAELERALAAQSLRLGRVEKALKDTRQREDDRFAGPVFRTLDRIERAARKLNRHVRNNLKSVIPPGRMLNSIRGRNIIDTPQPLLQSRASELLQPADRLPWPIVVDRKPRMERPRSLTSPKPSPVSTTPLVTVVLATFNSSSRIRETIQSILHQSYANFELLVVDDASGDNTCVLVDEFIAMDSRVRLVRQNRSRGIYWSWNTGIAEARGDIIAMLADHQRPTSDWLEKQLAPLRNTRVVATLSYGEQRQEENGTGINQRNLIINGMLPSLMIKKRIVQELGYFDTARAFAETEFHDRLRLVYGPDSIRTAPEPLFTGDWQETANRGSLSDKALHYIASYRKWHHDVSTSGSHPYVPFPVTNRAFQPHEDVLVEEKRFVAEPVVAFMATFPQRHRHLRRAVESLLPQVDHLFIYMNDYEIVPEYLRDRRITALAAAKIEDLRDIGKFYHMANLSSGYFFTVDDDIEYPVDYCDTLVRKIEDYDRKAIVGVHGVIFEQPLRRFFSDNRTTFRFQRELDVDTKVNLIGTGTMAFHSSTIALEYGSLPKGMADIGVAVAAKVNRVDMIAVARPRKWLTPIQFNGQEDLSLWDEFRENDDEHVEILKRYGDWSL